MREQIFFCYFFEDVKMAEDQNASHSRRSAAKTGHPGRKRNCHPGRSEAECRDLLTDPRGFVL
jgi:hypothetical protein